jgi:hypothetical protein
MEGNRSDMGTIDAKATLTLRNFPRFSSLHQLDKKWIFHESIAPYGG